MPTSRWSELKSRYLAMTGLSAYRDYYPHQISGGMAQRLALVRALCVEPGILLMDEPFSGLDEITARRIRSDLLSIWEETRKTIVFVTHNAYEACFLADRILVMSGGAFRQEIRVPIARPRSYDDPAIFELSRDVIKAFGEEIDREPVPSAIRLGAELGRRPRPARRRPNEHLTIEHQEERMLFRLGILAARHPRRMRSRHRAGQGADR